MTDKQDPSSLPPVEEVSRLIAQVKELDAKATKGTESWRMIDQRLSFLITDWDDKVDIAKVAKREDAAFIAAARELLPKAASLLERQAAKNQTLKEKLAAAYRKLDDAEVRFGPREPSEAESIDRAKRISKQLLKEAGFDGDGSS